MVLAILSPGTSGSRGSLLEAARALRQSSKWVDGMQDTIRTPWPIRKRKRLLDLQPSAAAFPNTPVAAAGHGNAHRRARANEGPDFFLRRADRAAPDRRLYNPSALRYATG